MIATPYVVISPVRNEAQFLPQTIQSMADQSLRPLAWIIVDDGSTDTTADIAKRAAAEYDWIKLVRRTDRGFRQAGGGVVEAFYAGYEEVVGLNWQFLVKLDGDLSFEKDYFIRCLGQFSSDAKLGIAGGTVCNLKNGKPEVESKVDPAFHVRGATKIYRRECWEQIGGLIRAPGWDTLDEVKANMLGWTSRTLKDLCLIHHRPAGGAYGQWNNLIKNGLANYVVGYHPLFMFLKCARRLFEKPFLVSGCGLGFGFLSGYLQRIPRQIEPAVLRYFRKQQFNRLLGRKSLWS